MAFNSEYGWNKKQEEVTPGDDYEKLLYSLAERFPCQSKTSRVEAMAKDCKGNGLTIGQLDYFVKKWVKIGTRFPYLVDVLNHTTKKFSTQAVRKINYSCPDKICDGTGYVEVLQDNVEYLRTCLCRADMKFLKKYSKDDQLSDYQREIANAYKQDPVFRKNDINYKSWYEKEV